jgi:hypothetical protein
MELEFSQQEFRRKLKYQICSVGSELFHVDGQTDMMKLLIAYCNFANMPKN